LFVGAVALAMYATPQAPPASVPSDTSGKANAEANARNAEIDRYIAEQNRILNVKIQKWTWKKGGFDNVMIASFTLKNENDFGVKDVVISCDHFAPSGTLIDRNTKTIYQAIKAKSAISVKDVNMGLLHTQVKSSSCSVKSVT